MVLKEVLLRYEKIEKPSQNYVRLQKKRMTENDYINDKVIIFTLPY